MAFQDLDEFGGGSDSGGFRAAPQDDLLMYFVVCIDAWAFRPNQNRFRIRTDSVEGRIWTDSDRFLDPRHGSYQPSSRVLWVMDCGRHQSPLSGPCRFASRPEYGGDIEVTTEPPMRSQADMHSPC